MQFCHTKWCISAYQSWELFVWMEIQQIGIQTLGLSQMDLSFHSLHACWLIMNFVGGWVTDFG